MKGVTATWQYATEEHIPADTFAKMFVDELGKIVGLMKIYGWMLYLKMIKEKKRNGSDNNLGNRSVSGNEEKQEAE